jgi:hypothetical protein
MATQADKFAPVRRADGSLGLTDERLDWHLDNLARWESAGWDAELAYTVSNATSGGVRDFSDACADVDRWSANETLLAMKGLAPVESAAIFNRIFHTVFRFREDADAAWRRARDKLAHWLHRRGLV